MAEYIFDPIEPDEDLLQDTAFAYLQAKWPDWVPNESTLEVWLIASLARLVAEAQAVASDVPPAIFQYFGESILGIARVDAQPASVGSTWVLIDNPAGRTIEAGTLVALEGADGDTVAFEVVTDVIVPVSTLTTTAGEVLLRSSDRGADLNDLGGNGIEASLIDSVSWVDTVTLTGATSNGADEELIDAYLSRLSEYLILLTPTPILPDDFSALAEFIAKLNGFDVRALALDGYDPGDATYDNERFVTVALQNPATGGAADSDVKTLVQDGLEAAREINFNCPVIDPTITLVDVTFVIEPEAGFTPSVALDNATAAITDYLTSSKWGVANSEAGKSDWILEPKVLRQRVSTVIDNSDGVYRWTTLTIGLAGGAQTTAEEFTLTGAAPVAAPGAILGTLA